MHNLGRYQEAPDKLNDAWRSKLRRKRSRRGAGHLRHPVRVDDENGAKTAEAVGGAGALGSDRRRSGPDDPHAFEHADRRWRAGARTGKLQGLPRRYFERALEVRTEVAERKGRGTLGRGDGYHSEFYTVLKPFRRLVLKSC